jgi:hypothetical protein
LTTQAEIDAAVEAITAAEIELAVGKLSAETYATLALEAAERVRPRRDPTGIERARQYRARKRDGRNVTGTVTPKRNVTHNVTRAVTGADGNVSARLPSSKADLLAQLIEAAGGNVQPGAIDTAPIAALLEQGCYLELDVLPAVRDLITHPLQPPLKSWGLPWLGKEIIRRRDERTAGADGRPRPPPKPL